MMERFDEIDLPKEACLSTSILQSLLKEISTTPSLYLKAGAIHGCALCRGEDVLLYMEDVGRHNAVDKIAGYMFLEGMQNGEMDAGDLVLYTTGRLTSEMVIKTVQMGIPVLVSRSGFTAWGVDLARQAGLTLVGRAKGKRFQVLSGPERIVFDKRRTTAMEKEPSDIVGLLLAGGLARRMGGGDKALRTLGGRTVLQRIIDTVSPQVSTLLLNANGDPARFAEYGLPVVPDVIKGFAGPLAGVLTGLEWMAENRPDARWLLTVPSDAPFMPKDLVVRLKSEMERNNGQLACASTNGRTHPVVGLWPVALKDDLRKAMVEEDMRKIDLWTARYNIVHVAFSTDPVDPFFNANRPEDFAEAEALLAKVE